MSVKELNKEIVIARLCYGRDPALDIDLKSLLINCGGDLNGIAVKKIAALIGYEEVRDVFDNHADKIHDTHYDMLADWLGENEEDPMVCAHEDADHYDQIAQETLHV